MSSASPESRRSLLPEDQGAWFPVIEGLPRPDWEKINAWIDEHCPDRPCKDEAWDQAAVAWLGRLAEALGPKYEIHGSERFLLLFSGPDDLAREILAAAEGTREAVFSLLGDVAWTQFRARDVVIALDTPENYYTYTSYFITEEGELGASAGMFLAKGYPHIAIQHTERAVPLGTITHELVHRALGHLSLPSWADEGLAVAITAETEARWVRWERGQDYWWQGERIQAFWSGEAFHRPESADVAYRLAYLFIRQTARNQGFKEFIRHAGADDAGAAAAREHLGMSLGKALSSLLGERDWEPQPQKWDRDAEKGGPEK